MPHNIFCQLLRSQSPNNFDILHNRLQSPLCLERLLKNRCANETHVMGKIHFPRLQFKRVSDLKLYIIKTLTRLEIMPGQCISVIEALDIKVSQTYVLLHETALKELTSWYPLKSSVANKNSIEDSNQLKCNLDKANVYFHMDPRFYTAVLQVSFYSLNRDAILYSTQQCRILSKYGFHYTWRSP